MKMFTCNFAQDGVTHQRLRVGSKSPSSPVLRPLKGKAAAILTRGAYAEYVSTEKWRERRWLACLPKLRRRHGGFFQQTRIENFKKGRTE